MRVRRRLKRPALVMCVPRTTPRQNGEDCTPTLDCFHQHDALRRPSLRSPATPRLHCTLPLQPIDLRQNLTGPHASQQRRTLARVVSTPGPKCRNKANGVGVTERPHQRSRPHLGDLRDGSHLGHRGVNSYRGGRSSVQLKSLNTLVVKTFVGLQGSTPQVLQLAKNLLRRLDSFDDPLRKFTMVVAHSLSHAGLEAPGAFRR